MDPIVTATIGALYFKDGGNELLVRLLGPTADYLGEEIKHIVENQMENLGRIFTKSESILGDKLNQPGQVPPRVLKQIWDEGRFVEDDLSAYYFAGILASSRSEDGRDDRALTYLNIIKSMSTYQIKFHYIIYSTFKTIFLSKYDSCGSSLTRDSMRIFIPFDTYVKNMDFSDNENPDLIIGHNLIGLSRLGLIDEFYGSGDKSLLSRAYPEIKILDFLYLPHN